MSWSLLGYAIAATDTSISSDMYSTNFTSTCTVLMNKGNRTFWLRMYGIWEDDFDLLAGGVPPVTGFKNIANTHSDWTNRYYNLTTSAGTAVVDRWHSYIESNTWTGRGPGRGTGPDSVHGSFTGEFIVDKNQTNQVTRTSIPRKLSSIESLTWWRYSRKNGWGHVTIRPTTGETFGVQYKDPHVLALPTGGWLMLLARYRFNDTTPPMGLPPTPNHTNSLSDIVAWYSDTPDFEGTGVIGPFLLVEDTHCWSEMLEYRLWIGVPGAVVVLNSDGAYELLVYYAVDECEKGYFKNSVGHPSDIEDEVEEWRYRAALEREHFKTGSAGKRILLNDLRAEIDAERISHAATGGRSYPNTTEASWTPASYDPVHAAVDGELMGRIRFWFPHGTDDMGVRSVVPFSDVYSISNHLFRAPAPLLCGNDPTQLHMYFAVVLTSSADMPIAATSRSLGTGHGIWHGRALNDNPSVPNASTGGHEHMRFGRDFICAPPHADANVSPDQVAESHYEPDPNKPTYPRETFLQVLYIDPDLVQLNDGTFWVAAGGGGFRAFGGDEADGCADASDAWDVTFPEIFPKDEIGDIRIHRTPTGVPPLQSRVVSHTSPRSPAFTRGRFISSQSATANVPRGDGSALPAQSESTASSATPAALPADAYMAKLRSRAIAVGNQ